MLDWVFTPCSVLPIRTYSCHWQLNRITAIRLVLHSLGKDMHVRMCHTSPYTHIYHLFWLILAYTRCNRRIWITHRMKSSFNNTGMMLLNYMQWLTVTSLFLSLVMVCQLQDTLLAASALELTMAKVSTSLADSSKHFKHFETKFFSPWSVHICTTNIH